MATSKFCNLHADVQKKIIASVILRLEKFNKDKATDPSTGELIPFDLKQFITQFYEDRLRRTGNRSNAVGITQMFPDAINDAITHMRLRGNTGIIKKLTDNGLSIDEVIKTAELFNSDIKEVVDFTRGVDPKLEVAAEAHLITHPKPNKGRPSKIELSSRSLNDILDELQDSFKPMALNFNTTTGQEAQEAIGGKYSNNRNPAKVPYYNTLKKVVNAFQSASLPNAETLEYDGHTGFKLAASLKNGEYVLTITDNTGKPILFNNDGSIDKINGKEMFYSLRTFNDETNNSLIHSVVTKYNEQLLRKKTTGNITEEERAAEIDKFKKEFTEERQNQIAITNQIIKELNDNPDSIILLDITGGSKGYIDTKLTPLSVIWNKLSQAEQYSILPDPIKGVPFITLKNTQGPVELRAKPVSVNPELMESIVTVLTKPVTLNGTLLNNQDKVTYVKQFLYSGVDVSVDTNGNIVLNIHGTVYDVTAKDASKQIYGALNNDAKKVYLNVNSDLIKNITYDLYKVNKDNSIQQPTKHDYVQDLLMPYVEINAKPNDDGEIWGLNGYFKWAPSAGIIKAMEPVLADNEKTNAIVSNVESSNPYNLEVNKLITKKGSPDQIVKAMRWWKNNPLSKHIKLEVLSNIVNSDAWATWNVAGITLFQGSDYTHTYHEAWHAFSQLYLSKEEKSALYEEASKQPGTFKIVARRPDLTGNPVDQLVDVAFKDATPRQLEEYIAEEFRSFAMSGGTKKITKTSKNSIFKKIWDYLKTLFTGVKSVDVITQPDSVNALSEIFNNLYTGNINHYTPNVSNIMFTSANAGIVDTQNLNEALNYAESKLITNSIDGLVSEYITSGGSYATTRAFATRNNRNHMFNSVKAKMVHRLETLSNEVATNNELEEGESKKWDPQTRMLKERNVTIIKFALDYWGDHNNITNDIGTMGFYKDHSEFSDQMKTPLDKEDATPDVNSTEDADIMKGLRGNDRKGNEMSSKQLADGLTLYLVRSLIEVDEKGKHVMNDLGFPKLASFPNTWNSLVRTVSGASTQEELYDRLSYLSKNGHPVYSQILQKLNHPAQVKEPAESRMWLKFWQDFNKPRIPLIAFIVNKDKAGNMTYKVGRASSDYFKTMRKWSSDFVGNSGITRYINKSTGANDKGVNYLNLGNIMNDFIKEEPDTKKNIIKYRVKPGKEFEFLKAIGVGLTDNNAIRNEIENQTEGINYIADNIALAYNAGLKIANPITFLSEKFKGVRLKAAGTGSTVIEAPNVRGRLVSLSEIETEFSDEYSSLSRVTPTGDKQYEQSLNSTMTGITDALNKAERFQDLYTKFNFQHMEYLDFDNNPAARSSVILNSLFVLDVAKTSPSWGMRRPGTEGNLNTIDLQNMSGSMIVDFDYSDHGVAHSGMSAADKFITDFHSVLSGGYFGQPQHGSKSSYFSSKVARLNTYDGKDQGHLYIDTKDFLPVPGSSYVKGTEEAFKIIKKYIQSEIERIEMVKADPFYKTVRGYEKADQFTLFDDNVLSENIKKALLKPAFIAAMKSNPSGILGALAMPEFAGIAKDLEKDFKDYFKGLTIDYTKNLLAKTNVTVNGKFLHDAIQSRVYEEILTSQGRSEDFIKKTLEINKVGDSEYEYVNTDEIAKLKQAAIRSFAFNSWIHKAEMMTLFYGDACQYNHVKEEFNKRNSTFASSGYIFATDSISTSYVNNYKNKSGEVNHMRGYAETLSNSPVRVFDGTMNTAIIKDNEIRSAYYDRLAKLFKDQGLSDEAIYGKGGTHDKPNGGLMGPYNEMKEGDGQGWVSFDAYKILKELEGKWSPAQDAAYQDVIAGKALNLAEINELFPVYKVQYAGNLKNTRSKATLPITSIHKFSLFPMIPTVIKDTPMEALHHKMIQESVDYTLFQSGSKLSSITANDSLQADSIFEDGDTSKLKFNPDGNSFTKNTIFLKYLKNQLDLNNNFKGKTTFSTQLRGLLNSGLIENGIPVDFMREGTYVVRHKAWNKMKEDDQMKESEFFRLSRAFEKDMSRLVQLNLEKLVEDVGWTWDSEDTKTRKPTGPMAPMVNFIREELTKQGFAKHEIDFIDVDPQGELIRDVSTSFSAPKIERLLMSIVNNRIVKQNLTGEALVQVAVTFSQNNKFQRPTKDELALYGTSGLPFYQPDPANPTKACKVKIALQGSFESLFKMTYLKDGKYNGMIAVYDTIDDKRVLNLDKSLARLNEMLRNEQWLDMDNNRKKITLTGVRIPVQGLNSMEFMEVYEFLPPIAGPIIILPSEIVAKSGGDFDVDKLTTYFPHLTRNGTWIGGDKYKSNKWKEAIDKDMSDLEAKMKPIEDRSTPEFKAMAREYNDLKDHKKNFIKSVQNSLINDIVSILALKENAPTLLTPNDVHLIKPIAGDMEKKVQPFNFKASRRIGGNPVSKGVSPSRILEEDYNFKKHQDNITGMGSLGIVAIDNKYNAIFNASGGYLQPTYSRTNAKGVVTTLPVTVYLKHNTVPLIEEGKEVIKDAKSVDVISISSLKDANNKNSIAEIDSQLVNGFVDVEKDAWVAFIQGNKEVTPMLLFLNRIGVPIEDSVAFVSNPLVRQYVEEQKILKGVLGDMMGKPYEKEQVKMRARTAMLNTLGIKARSSQQMFDEMQKFTKGEPFKTEELDTLVNKDVEAVTGNQVAIGAFLHYLYLENLMEGYNNLKSKTNVDTKKTPSLFDAQMRVQAVKELYENVNMPKSIINYIENKSSISGFFVQQFAADLWGGLFKLRNNENVNNYLMNILSDFKQKAAIENATGYSAERFVSEFKNDLVSYLFINHIKSFEVGASEYYKGMRVENKIPVTYAEGINKAAFVKDVNNKSHLFINIKNIEKEFFNKTYLTEAYGYSPVAEGAFSNSETGKKEYENFVVEREYLRNSFPEESIGTNTAYNNELTSLYSSVPELEGETVDAYATRVKKIAYENFLRDKALDNTFNFYKLFKAGEKSYPKRMMQVLDKYPHLVEKYSVLKQFAIRGLKKGNEIDADHVNLLLKDARDLDQDSATQYYDDMKELTTSKTLILGDTKEIAEENNFINDFFKRLSLFAFMQSGMTAGTETAFTSILPYDQYTEIITQAISKTDKKIDEAFLDDYLKLFKVNNSVSNKSGRITGKDWTKKLTPKILQGAESALPNLPMSPFIHRTGTPGVFVLTSKGIDPNTGKEITLNNSSLMQLATTNADQAYFVFNDSAIRQGLSTPESKKYLELYFQNRPTMFAHPDFGKGTGLGLRTYTGNVGEFIKKPGADINYKDPADLDKVKTMIDEDIAQLEAQFKAGKKIVFLESGYAQQLLKESQLNSPSVIVEKQDQPIVKDPMNAAPKSEFFLYLSEQLLDKFGYVNPGSEPVPSIMDILAKKQMITQQDIDERENQCK